jgi:hypothetical protein
MHDNPNPHLRIQNRELLLQYFSLISFCCIQFLQATTAITSKMIFFEEKRLVFYMITKNKNIIAGPFTRWSDVS